MKKLILYSFVVFCSACTFKEQDNLSTKTYVDLAGYFKKEALRLKQNKLPIDKMVMVNGKMEEKKVTIANWEKEFDSFISADINKASWRGAFKITKNDNVAIYTSNSDKIPVKKVEVTYQNEKITTIKIFVTNTNDLYTSKDTLSYYPDSLYEIKKIQSIKLMSEKKYQITGKFK
ncbi:hypothetical protein [Pedobacter sp. Hv1]|uniref:hypothetical protein n=1 Tax=Pedobacter sp. Hv1 TaxID=1740090 RepID=UPI0006D8C3D2|nr:hypothetical protein [Pedobacter sp. Hv1]KQB99090.1 hypothetical protein AQF98_19250 [Pedobacter sp. Hv1]